MRRLRPRRPLASVQQLANPANADGSLGAVRERVRLLNVVNGGRESAQGGRETSSCGNIPNIYSPPPSAVAQALEEQSNIRRWSEDSPFKPQGFI